MNEIRANIVKIACGEGETKTILKIGCLHIYLEKKFNWLQKKLLKFLLGIEIEEME